MTLSALKPVEGCALAGAVADSCLMDFVERVRLNNVLLETVKMQRLGLWRQQ